VHEGVPVEVTTGVEVFVDVGVPLGEPVDVAVGVPDWQEPPNTSENARAEPVSAPALSLMLITQLPFAF